MRIRKFLSPYVFCLLIAVIVGIFLRLYGLGIQSLWYDEIHSVTAVTESANLMDLLNNWLIIDAHPPLYHILLYYWVKIFGSTETVLRLSSAITGIITILIAYPLAKRLFNKNIAASFTVFIALSGFAIYYSQEARAYSLILLFSMLSTFVWLDIIGQITSSALEKKSLIAYGIIATVLAYLHYFGALLIFSQLAYLLFLTVKLKKYKNKIVSLTFLIIYLILPWVIFQFGVIYVYLGKMTSWMEGTSSNFFIRYINLTFNYVFWLLILPLVFNMNDFKHNLRESIKESSESYIVALTYLIFSPLLVCIIVSQFVPVLIPRYLIILLPAVYLLAASLISYVPGFNEGKGTVYIFVVSIIGLMVFLHAIPDRNFALKAFNQPYKQQYREASKYIAENYTSNSIILVDRYTGLYDYYFNRFFKENKNPVVIRLLSNIEINKYIKINRKIFIFKFDKLPKDIESSLDKKAKKHVKKDFYDLDIHEYTF